MNIKPIHIGFVITFLIGFLFYNCTLQNKDRFHVEADSIAFRNLKHVNDFLELSSFLIKYPDSKYFDEVVQLYFEKKRMLFDSIGWPIIDCFGNCANIKIRPNQEILFEFETTKLENLKDSLFVFFVNENNSELKSSQKEIVNYDGMLRRLSMGYVELTFIKDSCEIFQSVTKEISKSIDLYKNYLSKTWYNKDIGDLDMTRLQNLDSIINPRLLIISLEQEYFLPPPPPPDFIEFETN